MQINIAVFGGPDMLSDRGLALSGVFIDFTTLECEECLKNELSLPATKLIDRVSEGEFDYVIVTHLKGLGLEIIEVLPPEILAKTLVIVPPRLLDFEHGYYHALGVDAVQASNRPWITWLNRKIGGI